MDESFKNIYNEEKGRMLIGQILKHKRISILRVFSEIQRKRFIR